MKVYNGKVCGVTVLIFMYGLLLIMELLDWIEVVHEDSGVRQYVLPCV